MNQNKSKTCMCTKLSTLSFKSNCFYFNFFIWHLLYKFLWKYNLDMIYGHINYHNIELLSRFMKFRIFAAQQFTIVASSLGCVYYIIYYIYGIKWVH